MGLLNNISRKAAKAPGGFLSDVSFFASLRLGGIFLLAVFLTLSPAFTVQAQDAPAENWSQFRGNHQLTGVSQSQVPATLKQLWTYEAGESIESSAAIVGSTVFVGSQKGELTALNLDNGSVHWKYSTGNPIGESSPAYSDGAVFIGDLGGMLHAVNASRRQTILGRQAGQRDQIVARRLRRPNSDWLVRRASLLCLEP